MAIYIGTNPHKTKGDLGYTPHEAIGNKPCKHADFPDIHNSLWLYGT